MCFSFLLFYRNPQWGHQECEEGWRMEGNIFPGRMKKIPSFYHNQLITFDLFITFFSGSYRGSHEHANPVLLLQNV